MNFLDAIFISDGMIAKIFGNLKNCSYLYVMKITSLPYYIVDTFGNLYITGSFKGTATFSSTTLTSFGNADIFK